MENHFDFRYLKTGCGQVDPVTPQKFDLPRQKLKVPGCFRGEPVVENCERTLLRLAQMVGANARDAEQSELLCCFNSRVACKDSVLVVNEDRYQKTKLVDCPREFVDLLSRMDTRIVLIRTCSTARFSVRSALAPGSGADGRRRDAGRFFFILQGYWRGRSLTLMKFNAYFLGNPAFD